MSGHISHSTVEAPMSYRSPVPLFESGNDAADHGQADIDCPSPEAVKAIKSIIEKRSDLT
ncbi:hypothetical protein [Nocardia carnea]|uniref:hypothetical protein n=1 Tax=Nocardia carnea TaxID=37328 RepID=UPI003D79C9F2